ncbi:MAG TPA: hypothetical protein VJA94_01535 [Candidatus Angelobacter sp.]
MIASIRATRLLSTLLIAGALLALVMATTATFGQSTADRFAGLTPRPTGRIQAHGTIGYIPPVGWRVQNGADGITILTGPVPDSERPCEIWMLPPMPAQGDLANEGVALVESLAAAKKFGPYRGEFGRDVRLSREEGVSGTGWTYADLSGQLGNSGITVRVLMAQMGQNVLSIIGYSKTWNCLGNQSMRDNDVWALLFHSLQLPGFTEESPQLAQQLIGTWSSASGSAGNTLIFAKNGRFGSVALYHSYAASSTPGMVWEINKSWQGDGPYEAHGDRLHTRNPKGSETERNVTRLFSIVRVPKADRPAEFDYVLRVVERSWDGSQTWGFSPSGNYVTHMTKEKSAR